VGFHLYKPISWGVFSVFLELEKSILIMDNDSVGDQLASRLFDLIDRVGFEGSTSRHSPETRGLDWNDVLMSV